MKLIEEEYKLITETRECQLISLEEPFLSTSQDEITKRFIKTNPFKIFRVGSRERKEKELLKKAENKPIIQMSKNSRGKLILTELER